MDELQTKFLKRDRMRFTLNTLSGGLALLAIVFNVFYFVSIYKSDFNFYYNFDMGISVLMNLVFMLTVFLCAEGVKRYKLGYAVTLLIVGAIEFARIFFLPLSAHSYELTKKAADGTETVSLVMETPQFVRVVVYLSVAAALLVAAGVIGIVRSKQLEKHNAELAATRNAEV